MNWEKNVDEKDFVLAIAILAGIALAFFVYVNFIPKSGGKISASIIRIEGCDECFDLNQISKMLNENSKLEIKSDKTLDYNSKEAENLIKKYQLTRIPALIIISRNIEKAGLDENIFTFSGNTAIFDKPVPYLNPATKEVSGIVNLKEIYDGNCKECSTMYNARMQLEQAGIKIGDYEKVPYSSDLGKQLVKENNILILPSLLISKSIKEYWWIYPAIQKILRDNGEYIYFDLQTPPYKEISSGLIKGKVDFTYLINNSCLDCFNVTQLKSAFQQLGVYISNEKYADVSSDEGKNLLASYKITAIPTVILSNEINDYTNLKDLLEKVGTFENGKYIFRNLDSLKVKYQKTGG